MADSDQVPIWKDLSAKELEQKSVHFKPPPSTRTMDVVDAVSSSGYDDLLSVQISVKKCILTFLSRENAEAIAEHGIDLGGSSYSLCLVSEAQVELKIVDAPIWIPDEEILSRLSAFGTRRGSVRHGFVRTPAGIKIATGVRYVNFRLHHNRHVPSYVRTTEGAGKSPIAFRVTYDGQVRTCRHCNLPGHLAADCPRRSSRHAESASTANDSQNQHESNLTQNNQRTTANTTNTNSYTQQQQPRAQHQATPAKAQSTTQKAFSALFTPQTTSPPLPLIATSRGKSAHDSPDLDNDGFQLAKGKHTFSQAARNRTVLNSSNSTLADADPQMLWARDSSASEMDLIRQRVRFRQSRRSSQ